MATCRVQVIVHPGARREGLAWRADGLLRVEVTAAPEWGRANAALVELLASRLGIPPQEVRVVQGKTARRKTVELPLPRSAVVRLLGVDGEQLLQG